MIAILDYKAGNLTSVRLAFESLGVDARITSVPEEILQADHVVFPGVGAAGSAMATLGQMQLGKVIRQVVAQGTPFLGICLGTQIIFERSEEGATECLGILPGPVRRFCPVDPFDKVPHMGWNRVHIESVHPVLAGMVQDSEFYFVHSYFPDPADPALVLGRTQYAGVSFASVVGRGNLLATQFHPEKSGRVGLALLRRFSEWDGKAKPC